MKTKQEYAKKYRDPRWQKKRLEVMQRDEFTCQSCCDDTKTLNVHHRFYLPDKEPWEYPSDVLITLCEDCHEEEKEGKNEADYFILQAIRLHFLNSDIHSLADGLFKMKLCHLHEVVASVFEWVFTDKNIQIELIERYFEYLLNKNKNKI